MCVGKGGVDHGWEFSMPLPPHPQRYCDPASLVLILQSVIGVRTREEPKGEIGPQEVGVNDRESEERQTVQEVSQNVECREFLHSRLKMN